MINALGLLEVKGLAAGIEAADAMLKAARVRILSQTVTNPALITLVIEGDLAACRAALDAGAEAAGRLGTVLVKKEIGRPDDDTAWFVSNLNASNDTPSNKNNKLLTSVADTGIIDKKIDVAEVAEITEVTQLIEIETIPQVTKDALLAFIGAQEKGCNLTEIVAKFDLAELRDDIKKLLQECVNSGALRKRSNRYYVC